MEPKIKYGIILVNCPTYRKQIKVPYQQLGTLFGVNICDDGCGSHVCDDCVKRVYEQLKESPPPEYPLYPQ